jgi:hypothetical protein
MTEEEKRVLADRLKEARKSLTTAVENEVIEDDE